MSVIAGMYNFQEPVVRSQELAHLAAALRERTLDRIDQATSGGIGMLVAVLLTVAEEYPVPQPLTCPNGLMLAWDGRLDNRDTLLHSLGSLHQPSADAQLVLGTYERRGPCFAAELLGDFAFALWDPSARRLLLGRDLAGTRPLFYYATSEKLVWASDIRVLLSMPEVSADIDDEFVAGYLSREAEPWRTPYRAIRALPAGHVLTARVGGIEVTRFWQPDPYRQIRYATDVEYEEHFRSLFREAVRVRLRAKGTVCAELSGGLDSSAIVCVADGLIKRGEVAATNLSTISFVYDSSPTSDEREFIAEVDRLRGVQGFHLREEDNRILSKLDFPDGFDMPTGRRVFAGFYDQLSEAMEQVGASVLLSGTAGDQVMWGEVAAPFDLADFLKQLRLGMFLRNLHAWSIDQRRPLFQLVWQAAVWPLLPRAMRTNGGPYHQVPQWLHPRFVASTNVKDRMLGPSEVEQYGFRLPSRREQFATIQEVIKALWESLQNGARYCGH